MPHNIYAWVKAYGIALFIPVSLASGVFAGYFIAEFFKKEFHAPEYVFYIIIGLGALAGIVEAVRLIRIISKIRLD
ncbi:MAG: hypothetical protein MUF05_00860 [Candidatus Omnitrophica bacterium]|jgi:hypothetical protein|nr:hypothetical protein [Candidatus Omnitrophota bacterium]